MAEDLRAGKPAVDHPAFPEILSGRFKVLSRLKDSDLKQVYLLQDGASGAQYALKVAPAEDLPSLQREYELLMRLHDDAFPHPVFCFAERKNAYLLREYAPGRTLSEWVEADGPLSERRATDVARRVCAAVDKLQSLEPPVVHRDIKPQNLIVDQGGGIRLIDLDAVEEYDPEKPFDTMVVGTVRTAAPEQYGYRRCDARTDVYAVGMLLVYLLTGGYDRAALKQKHVSRPLRQIILRCLEFDPDRRPASARQLMGLIDAWKRRWRRWAVSAACIAVALALTLTSIASGERLFRFFESASTLAFQPVHAFASPLIERAVRMQLNRPVGSITQRDLLGVTELYLCAGTSYKSWDDTKSFGGSAENAVAGDLSDLERMPNLRMLGLGHLGIRDLGEIGKLPLERLCLTNNDISDLTPILGMETLQELDIAGNPVFDLNGLEKCPLLKALNISNTPLKDLSSLEKLHLKKLYMFDMQEGLDATVLARLNGLEEIGVRGLNRGGIDALMKVKTLQQVLLFSCELGSLAPLRDMPQLFSLSLWGCKQFDLQEVSSLKLSALELRDCSLDSIEALRGNATLIYLNISKNPLNDYSVLNTLPKLTQVICSNDQRPQMDALPGNKAFAVTYEDM